MCGEQNALAKVVADAVQKTYDAKAAYDSAFKSNRPSRDLAALLATARTEERSAVKALDAHRKEHRC